MPPVAAAAVAGRGLAAPCPGRNQRPLTPSLRPLPGVVIWQRVSRPPTLRPSAYRGPPPPAPPPLYGGSPGPGGPAPPPPPPRRSSLDAPPSARTLLTAAVVGLISGALWWAALYGHDPVKLAVDDRTGFVYAKTAGGAKVLISQDEEGRFIFVDQAGDLYYQAGGGGGAGGDGFYIVDPQNNIYNSFYDEDGKPKLVSVGRMEDVVTFRPEAIGGVPADRLAALVGQRDAGSFTAIYTGADDPSDPLALDLPPNAPTETDGFGRTTGPAALQEGVMLLEQKKGLFGRTEKPDPKDALDRIAAFSDRAEELGEEYDKAAKAGVRFPRAADAREAPELVGDGEVEMDGE